MISSCLWWDGVTPPPRSSLPGNLDVDVAIIGAGYSGLWTALALKQRDPKLRIAIVESRHVRFGASGRNGGWASALYPLSFESVRRQHGERRARALTDATQGAVRDLGLSLAELGISADYSYGGTFTVARNKAQKMRLQQTFATAHERDDLRWLEGADLTRAINVTGGIAALYNPHCARVQPAKLVTGLAAAVERLGIPIFERTRVERIDPAQGQQRPRAVTTHGEVTADVIVRATEGYTPQLPGLRRRVVPIYSLMISTQPQSDAFFERAGLADNETFADERHLIVYGQRTADNRLAFGGRGAPYHFGSTVDDGFDANKKVASLLWNTLLELFPFLEGSPTHHWGGPLAFPRDGSPFVNFDESTGLAELGGYTGDGVTMSFLAGYTMADLICRDETERTDLPFVNHPARRWETEPFRWLGVNAGLTLAKHSDAVETRDKSSRASRLLARLLP